jgi:hypothetical protein
LFASGRGQKERKLLKENPQEILQPAAVAEFSRITVFEQLRGGRTVTLNPSEDESLSLCKRFGLAGLPYFKCDILTSSMPGKKSIKLQGQIEAMVVQMCTMTNEPFSTSISSKFECILLEKGDDASATNLEEDGNELDVEDVEAGEVDLGEISAQYLALELNPYPTAPGVSAKGQWKFGDLKDDNGPPTWVFGDLEGEL